MGAVGKAERGTGAAHFFHGDDMLQIAEPQAAVLLRYGNAMQTEFAHLFPELVARKPVLAIDFFGERGNLLVCEAGRSLTDHLDTFAELEIELGGRAHRLSSRARESNCRQGR